MPVNRHRRRICNNYGFQCIISQAVSLNLHTCFDHQKGIIEMFLLQHYFSSSDPAYHISPDCVSMNKQGAVQQLFEKADYLLWPVQNTKRGWGIYEFKEATGFNFGVQCIICRWDFAKTNAWPALQDLPTITVLSFTPPEREVWIIQHPSACLSMWYHTVV